MTRLVLPLVDLRLGDQIQLDDGWAEIITPPRQNRHNPKEAGVPHVGFAVRKADGRGSQIRGPHTVEVPVRRPA